MRKKFSYTKFLVKLEQFDKKLVRLLVCGRVCKMKKIEHQKKICALGENTRIIKDIADDTSNSHFTRATDIIRQYPRSLIRCAHSPAQRTSPLAYIIAHLCRASPFFPPHKILKVCINISIFM